MTSIERTAYPRFTRAPSVKELREIYTPTSTDIAFVATTARGPAQIFGLMILLKVYQRLGYFPKPETIPGAIIGHIRAVMKLPADLVPDIASNHTLYRYYAAIREHLEIQSEGKHIRHVAAQAMHQAAQVMENPADLISAAIEILVEGLRYAKVKHLAEEAHSLHATNLWDFAASKRLTLLVCLIAQAQVSTRDEILQMFTKRMSKLTSRAKEELERLR
ncbi:MAG: DUF4158 domain-containing protein, partial [Chloroflexi bacterium]